MEATVDSVIRTRGLAKSYRGRSALQGIDLDVPHNVVFGYLGPNGAGKTTTIRPLTGLLRLTAGPYSTGVTSPRTDHIGGWRR
jgi:ABC-2 type transport system ATP-binding protein